MEKKRKKRLDPDNWQRFTELRDEYQALYNERERRYDKFQNFIDTNYIKTDKIYDADLLEVEDPGLIVISAVQMLSGRKSRVLVLIAVSFWRVLLWKINGKSPMRRAEVYIIVKMKRMKRHFFIILTTLMLFPSVKNFWQNI